MRDIKFTYTVVRPNGHIFSELFPLGDIESGYVHRWLKNNNIGGHDKIHKRQFTGLHDKNGKEIYEGDIVKASSDEYYSNDSFCMDELDFTGVVLYESAMWILGEKWTPMSWMPLCDACNSDIALEIIGNIHANPELLEGLA